MMPPRSFFQTSVALEVVGVEPGGFEERIGALAVGHHRGRREGVLAVAIVEHHAVVRGALPGDFPVFASTAKTFSACL